MKRYATIGIMLLLTMLGVVLSSAAASAEEQKLVGVVMKIDLAADGTSAVVMLKDNKTDQEMAIFIDDTLTLDKLKDHRIGVGDEIRCKFEPVDGKNRSRYFRKTAGC